MSEKWFSIAKKISKYLIGLLLLLFCIYSVLGLYVSTHHEVFLNDVRNIANEHCNGEVTIGDVEVLFFKGFPNVAIAVKDVTIKDSLWAQHKKTLLKNATIHLEIAPWAIFLKKIKLNTISIQDATVDLYIRKDGYSNTAVFTSTKKTTNKKSPSLLSLEINQLQMKKIHFISENELKYKKFDFEISKLIVQGENTTSGWKGKAQIETLVQSMAFNTQKGSFAKNKVIKGTLIIEHNKSKGNISVLTDALTIGEDRFKIISYFGTTALNSKYSISIINSSISWQNAYNLLSNNIKSRLKIFKLSPNFDVRCDIVGDFSIEGDPYIHVLTHMNNKVLAYNTHKITECFFNGEFTNRFDKNKSIGNENSAILLHNFRGKSYGIPFKTKSMMILNFDKPIASGYVETNFELKGLNKTPIQQYLKFSKGNADIKVLFKADVVNLEMKKPYLIGLVKFDQVNYTYLPKNMNFFNSKIDLEFTTNQLKVKTINLSTKNSTISMSGYSDNFMNLYYDDPKKIEFAWKAKASRLYLTDFFKNSTPTQVKKVNQNKLNQQKESSHDLDFFETLDQTNGNIDLIADEIIYKKFKAKKAIAKIRINNQKIELQQASLQFGNGGINLKGNIFHKNNINPFVTTFNMNNVDIQEVLYAFDNFGSTTLTYKNINGKLNLNGNLNGVFSSNGDFVSKAAQGDLTVNIAKGALTNFEPIKKIGKYAFPFRNFDKVTINPLLIQLNLNNGIAKLSPTYISSSVLNFDIVGIYGYNGNTDLQVDVHLRDPKKDKDISNKEIVKENRSKGITIHLQAINDSKGNIKVKLRSKNERLK